jgi:hypothetical protein
MSMSDGTLYETTAHHTTGSLIHVADILRELVRAHGIPLSYPEPKTEHSSSLFLVFGASSCISPVSLCKPIARTGLAASARKLVWPDSGGIWFPSLNGALPDSCAVYQCQFISIQDIEDEEEAAAPCAFRSRCLGLATVICRWAYCSVVGDSARGPYLTVLSLLSESGTRLSVPPTGKRGCGCGGRMEGLSK